MNTAEQKERECAGVISTCRERLRETDWLVATDSPLASDRPLIAYRAALWETLRKVQQDRDCEEAKIPEPPEHIKDLL